MGFLRDFKLLPADGSLILILLALLGSPQAYADALPSCAGVSYGQDSASTRVALLTAVQAELIETSSAATAQLEGALFCLRNSSESCNLFKDELMKLLSQQVDPIKMFHALSQIRNQRYGRLSRNALLNLIKEDRIRPENVANFRSRKYEYTDADKAQVSRLWENFALDHIASEIDAGDFTPTTNSCMDFYFEPTGEIAHHLRAGFKNASDTLLESNPLLAFLTEHQIKDSEAIESALEELIAINKNFQERVAKLRVSHGEYWLLPWEFINDHEMGLLNFGGIAEKVVAGMTDPVQKANSCVAWDELSRLQTAKMRASIGLGFSTAVLCGAALWSGIGAPVALGACGPAIADGTWGAIVGKKTYDIANLSLYSGRRSLGALGGESDEIMSINEARDLMKQSQIVIGVNILGLFPVIKGIRTAVLTKGSHGTIGTLVTLPASDASVSATEVFAARVVSLYQLAKSRSKRVRKLKTGHADVFEFQRECNELLNI